MVYYLVNMAFE
jgi:hypothetical protein